ncbi:MAG: VWA domain-containing protein [Pyrinomonadaceae bacterium]
MLRSFLLFLIVTCFFVFASNAQSGRRISKPSAPEPTPVPESSYSESRSDRIQRLYPRGYKKPEDQQVKPQSETPTVDADGDEVISVESSLVAIPVSVYNRDGFYVPNIKKEEVRVFEDGVEQEIAYFNILETPFTVALLLDTSPSTVYKIEEIRFAAKAFVRQLQPEDSVMVIEFDGNPHILTEATTDREKIFRAIDKADFGYGTGLYDAVDMALNKKLSKITGRKAVVLFTDGVDTTSRHSYLSTVSDAEEATAVIFSVYYNTYLDGFGGAGSVGGVINGGIIPSTRNQGRGTSAQEYAIGKAYLEDLSTSTGGKVFRPESTPGGLASAFRAIADELHQQYNLGYYPLNEGKRGERKAIKVRIYRPELVIRAKDGYIVGSESQTSTK